jgi:hypothetical protein
MSTWASVTFAPLTHRITPYTACCSRHVETMRCNLILTTRNARRHVWHSTGVAMMLSKRPQLTSSTSLPASTLSCTTRCERCCERPGIQMGLGILQQMWRHSQRDDAGRPHSRPRKSSHAAGQNRETTRVSICIRSQREGLACAAVTTAAGDESDHPGPLQGLCRAGDRLWKLFGCFPYALSTTRARKTVGYTCSQLRAVRLLPYHGNLV